MNLRVTSKLLQIWNTEVFWVHTWQLILLSSYSWIFVVLLVLCYSGKHDDSPVGFFFDIFYAQYSYHLKLVSYTDKNSNPLAGIKWL